MSYKHISVLVRALVLLLLPPHPPPDKEGGKKIAIKRLRMVVGDPGSLDRSARLRAETSSRLWMLNEELSRDTWLCPEHAL